MFETLLTTLTPAARNGWLATYLATLIPFCLGLRSAHAPLTSYLWSPLLALPVLALGVAAATLLVPTLLQSLPGATPTTALIVNGTFTALLGLLGGRYAGTPRDPVRVRRGTQLKDGRELQVRRPPRGATTLAGIPLTAAEETRHVKILGVTGAGKSTAIRELLAGALARGDRAMVADPDGGYCRRFFDATRGDVILNPFDARSHRWNLFRDITQPYDIDQIARSLIPDAPGSADREWRGYARTFLTSVTRQLYDADVHDMAELWRLLAIADTEELRLLVGGTPAQPFLEESNARMFGSIRSVTASTLAGLELIATQSGRSTQPELSVCDWVRRGGRSVLFLPYESKQIAALKQLISAWMRLAIFETMSLPEEGALNAKANAGPAQRLYFVIDELDALGAIDGLKDALTRLRKFGGRCVLGFQSIAQVIGTYGPQDADAIVENCGNTLILRCSASRSGGTARFASDLIGTRELARPQLSTSRRSDRWLATRTHSEQIVTESAVLPSEIEQLPDLQGYLKRAAAPEWRIVQLTRSR